MGTKCHFRDMCTTLNTMLSLMIMFRQYRFHSLMIHCINSIHIIRLLKVMPVFNIAVLRSLLVQGHHMFQRHRILSVVLRIMSAKALTSMIKFYISINMYFEEEKKSPCWYFQSKTFQITLAKKKVHKFKIFDFRF